MEINNYLLLDEHSFGIKDLSEWSWRYLGPPERWYLTTTLQCHNPQDLTLNRHHHEHHKSCITKESLEIFIYFIRSVITTTAPVVTTIWSI